jgi:uncharacterized protein (DUF488 family)
MPAFYTIGHSNHPVTRLIELLQQHRIDLVADVRRYPTSRHNPQFNKPALSAELERNGICYRFIGDKLGGKDDLERVKARPEFAEGIEELMALAAQEKRIVILCAEEDPRRCHRHWLLEPEFNKRGVKIIHIRGDGKLETDKQLKLF